jgi:hypothetical protein
MTTLAVRQSVADYDTWETAFDGHEKVRRSHGATGHRVLRNGNDILVLVEFPDEASAQAFGADPSLREVMAEAGVVGTPDITLRNQSSAEQY